MGGLGNGRRGGRSPPLLIAALIACILILGFNYWVSSSRNLELQTKLYELEGQVRRGAAERGVVEMKKTEFQEEIQRQREQLSNIESIYKRQLEGAQNTCGQEKVILQQNISSSVKTIQDLKGQLNQLNDDVGQLQKELQSCQGSIKTLNDKLTYDMTHCNSQVLSQKELCDERLAAAKLEAQKKIDKILASSQQANAVDETVKDKQAVPNASETSKVASVGDHTASPKAVQPSELLSNDITAKTDVTGADISDKGLSTPKLEPLDVPTAAGRKLDILPPPEGAEKAEESSKPLESNVTENKDIHLMEAKDETHTDDPGMEDMLLTEGKADDAVHKADTQEEYYAEDRAVAEESEKASKRENLDQEEEDLADYNGDDENEGEFEADKQAALAQT